MNAVWATLLIILGMAALVGLAALMAWAELPPPGTPDDYRGRHRL